MSFLYPVSFSTIKTGSGNDVTHGEENTINVESVSLRDTDSQTESRGNVDAILSCDPVSRDATLQSGVGARPKTTKTLQRKNTPAVLPKVDSLYSTSTSSVIFVWLSMSTGSGVDLS